MGTLTAGSIVDKAELVLQDTSNVHWTEAELLGWLNDAQRQIVMLRPDASSTVAVITLVAGSKQSLPSGALRLLEITRNMGNGSTPGEAVRLVDREALDAHLPTWHTAAQVATAKHYVYDERAPRTFYVYPPSNGTSSSVEAIYSVAPTDVAAVGNAITLDDIYENQLLDWILYRAFSKDAEVGSMEKAMAHFSSFTSALGAKSGTDIAFGPGRNSPPAAPATRVK